MNFEPTDHQRTVLEFEIRINEVLNDRFVIDITGLTDDQIDRLTHHVGQVSTQVFEASVRSMLKGVQKYGLEPSLPSGVWQPTPMADVLRHWLPHIFSEGVDVANQTGLLADTFGVDVLP